MGEGREGQGVLLHGAGGVQHRGLRLRHRGLQLSHHELTVRDDRPLHPGAGPPDTLETSGLPRQH